LLNVVGLGLCRPVAGVVVEDLDGAGDSAVAVAQRGAADGDGDAVTVAML
jgi:hypothetical protein